MMKFKKIMAISLITSMVMGSSVMAFAADREAEASGSGEVEYVAKGDVFDVVFPTVAENATTFDYIVDPDGLIQQTDAEKYGGKSFEDGKSVFFLRSTASNASPASDYMGSSDEITVVNKSTQSINLEVTAKVTAVDGIQMATDSNAVATATESPTLYLAVSGKGTDDATATETGITVDGISLTNAVAADATAYEVVWNDTTKQYEMDKTEAAQADTYNNWKSYTFQLTGACNNHADWKTLEGQAPQVDLVWSVKDFTASGPQISITSSGKITVTGLTTEKKYKEMTIAYPGGSTGVTEGVTWNTDGMNPDGSGNCEIQFSEAWMEWLGGQRVTVNFVLSDDSQISASTTLDAR